MTTIKERILKLELTVLNNQRIIWVLVLIQLGLEGADKFI
jgi:hypothetical protein